MYLHKDTQLFEDVVNATSGKFSIEAAIIEKDYYVTMVLKLLSKYSDKIVFKGGTSLSKCFRIIDRFSEDIDITFTEHIGEARRKKLKYNIMKSISEELNFRIDNWDEIESDKDLNNYVFTYESITGITRGSLRPGIKVETALASYAFPVEEKEVFSYIYRYLQEEKEDELIREYDLALFSMKVQALERTYIDKVFALCDYYMKGKSKRYSRHLYDLYKLQPKIEFDENFCTLIKEVRAHRMKIGEEICPSAQEDVIISEKLREFCENDFYKTDYAEITEYFVHDPIPYEDTIHNIYEIIRKECFSPTLTTKGM